MYLHECRSIDKPINEGLEISKDLFSNRDDFKLTHKKFEDNEDRCARDKSVRKDFENSGLSIVLKKY